MWDERYAAEEYAYGTEPNDFLKNMIEQVPSGRVLCVAEGEGRNAVFLAEHGYHVTAIDASAVGLEKANKLAAQRKVTINTECHDLTEYMFPKDAYSGVVSIFCHLPPEARKRLHKKLVETLLPGGVLVLEAYTPEQLKYKTGGPPVEEMAMTLSALKQELKGLEFVHAKELVREVVEGKYHTGTGAVVQIIAVKPKGSSD